MDFFIIIPARYGSKRLPGKPLLDICGKPMVLRVVERASLIPDIKGLFVATDDEKIKEVVEDAGFNAIMTSREHPSGTDRIYEAAKKVGLSKEDVVINCQGDQPLLDILSVQKMVSLFKREKDFLMTTVATPINFIEAQDPNRVKVVLDKDSRALYFSRSPIPYDRDRVFDPKERCYLRHLGLYCYTMELLERFVSWPVGSLEQTERLEQLRVLENGYKIGVAIIKNAPIDVDTIEDLEAVRSIFKNMK